MLLLLIMALSEAQQAQHDHAELAIYQRVQADEVTIADIWRPSAKLLADYRKARRCYVRFHLYRVADCSAELTKVDLDLGNLEMARTGGQ